MATKIFLQMKYFIYFLPAPERQSNNRLLVEPNSRLKRAFLFVLRDFETVVLSSYIIPLQRRGVMPVWQ